MFSLDLARAHIHDLHREAEQSHRPTNSRLRTRIRRLVDRANHR